MMPHGSKKFQLLLQLMACRTFKSLVTTGSVPRVAPSTLMNLNGANVACARRAILLVLTLLFQGCWQQAVLILISLPPLVPRILARKKIKDTSKAAKAAGAAPGW